MTEELKPAKSKKAEDSEEEVIKEQMKVQYRTYIFILLLSIMLLDCRPS
ncbi:MAG: hypothetical protein KGD68_04735 [Candidatus Lokiarchaeota archaeon]|nr:hypothetical protein [Candidatus Lokiarchaeota archaeon]